MTSTSLITTLEGVKYSLHHHYVLEMADIRMTEIAYHFYAKEFLALTLMGGEL